MPVFAQRLKSEELELLQPHFYCPNCHRQRAYEVKPASIDFTYYYLTVFDAKNLDHFIVCQACKRGFDPLILKPSNQTLFRLVGATKYELMHAGSPGALKLKLMNDGFKEGLVDKLITLAQS